MNQLDDKRPLSQEALFELYLGRNLLALEQKGLPRPKPYRGVELVVGGTTHGAHFVLLDDSYARSTTSYLLEVANPDLPEGGFDILVDAGYGSLSTYRRAGLSMSNVRVIVLTHVHLDHIDDLSTCILQASFSNRPITLIANPTVIYGGPGQPSPLSEYFRSKLDNIVSLTHGESIEVLSVLITATPSYHKELPGANFLANSYRFDFCIQNNKFSFGYLSDGPIIDQDGVIHIDVIEPFLGVDVLLANIGTVSRGPTIPNYLPVFSNAMCLHGLREVINFFALHGCMPKKIIISSLGAEMIEIRDHRLQQFIRDGGFANLIDLLKQEVCRFLADTGADDTEVIVPCDGDRILLFEM